MERAGSAQPNNLARGAAEGGRHRIAVEVDTNKGGIAQQDQGSGAWFAFGMPAALHTAANFRRNHTRCLSITLRISPSGYSAAALMNGQPRR